jgi:hypothetical protein
MDDREQYSVDLPEEGGRQSVSSSQESQRVHRISQKAEEIKRQGIERLKKGYGGASSVLMNDPEGRGVVVPVEDVEKMKTANRLADNQAKLDLIMYPFELLTALGGLYAGAGSMKDVGKRPANRGRAVAALASASVMNPQEAKAVERKPQREINKAEINRIYEKINEKGIQELEPAELKMLDRYEQRQQRELEQQEDAYYKGLEPLEKKVEAFKENEQHITDIKRTMEMDRRHPARDRQGNIIQPNFNRERNAMRDVARELGIRFNLGDDADTLIRLIEQEQRLAKERLKRYKEGY